MSSDEDFDMSQTYNLRVPKDLMKRVENLVLRAKLRIDYRTTGHRTTRADVMRAALFNGVEALEAAYPPLPPEKPT